MCCVSFFCWLNASCFSLTCALHCRIQMTRSTEMNLANRHHAININYLF